MPVYEGEDGSLLHYDMLGGDSASPLIVLAGGAARHPEYLGDLAGLSGHHQVLVPHLRGVGRSSAADISDRGSWWHQARDIDRLRASLDLNRCAVVAHSAGTRLAIEHCGHIPWVEQPAAFREILDPFLSALDARKAAGPPA